MLEKLRRLLVRLGLVPEAEVHYIGGSDTLPPPLTREREAELLADMNEAARQELIEHNLRLVVYIARRFENTGINIEDLISIGTIGLIKAVGTYRTDKNIKLATYASRCIENEILMYLRKNASRRLLRQSGTWHPLPQAPQSKTSPESRPYTLLLQPENVLRTARTYSHPHR